MKQFIAGLTLGILVTGVVVRYIPSPVDTQVSYGITLSNETTTVLGVPCTIGYCTTTDVALRRADEVLSSTTVTNTPPEKSPCEIELDKIRKDVRP